MTVRDLINALLHQPMDAEISVKIHPNDLAGSPIAFVDGEKLASQVYVHSHEYTQRLLEFKKATGCSNRFYLKQCDWEVARAIQYYVDQMSETKYGRSK